MPSLLNNLPTTAKSYGKWYNIEGQKEQVYSAHKTAILGIIEPKKP